MNQHDVMSLLVILCFIAGSLVIGFSLFAGEKRNSSEAYQRGRTYALWLYTARPNTASSEIEKCTEAARVFLDFNDFDQGMLDVKAEKEAASLETYEEAKRRGSKFASQILRNYPETGLMTLQEAYERHSQGIDNFDQAFADGIQEVLDHTRDMGK